MVEKDFLAFDFYVIVWTILMKNSGFRIIVIPLNINHVTTMKYFDVRLGFVTPSVIDDYLIKIFILFCNYYRNSKNVEDLLYSKLGTREAIASLNMRYPFFTLRLRLLRKVLLSFASISITRTIYSRLARRSVERRLKEEPVEEAIEAFRG
ncbi:MAG: hypothetical protein QW292_10210 [Candidatus Parvarchaeota archaeon]